jgi:hypothetical protein
LQHSARVTKWHIFRGGKCIRRDSNWCAARRSFSILELKVSFPGIDFGTGSVVSGGVHTPPHSTHNPRTSGKKRVLFSPASNYALMSPSRSWLALLPLSSSDFTGASAPLAANQRRPERQLESRLETRPRDERK